MIEKMETKKIQPLLSISTQINKSFHPEILCLLNSVLYIIRLSCKGAKSQTGGKTDILIYRVASLLKKIIIAILPFILLFLFSSQVDILKLLSVRLWRLGQRLLVLLFWQLGHSRLLLQQLLWYGNCWTVFFLVFSI